MANTVIALKKSGTPSSVPSNLANGELAINYADGKLYYKAANGTIASISGNEPNYFGSVNAGGTFVVADTPADILTLVAGDNITIAGDAINDTITISATLPGGGDPTYAFNQANLAYAQANAAYDAANNAVTDYSPAFNQANLAYAQANAANVLAFNTGIGANAYTNSVGAASNTYAESIGTAGNNYTNSVGAGVNSYARTVGTAGNNYTNSVGAAGNNYTNSVGTAGNNYTNGVGAAGNNYTNSVGTAGNNYTNSVGAAGNNYTNSVGAASNNYADLTFVKLTSSYQTITGNIAITGSLSVAGNAYTIDSETLKISDPLIYLAGNNYTSDIVDIGFVGNYVNATGQNVHTGFFRDATTKEYYVFEGYDAEPTPNHIDTAGNNFTISVLNATLKTSNLILGGANAIVTIGHAFDRANSATTTANNALPNTSGVSFNGTLGFPTGNVAVGIATPNTGAKLQVYNTSGNSELWITADNGYDPTLRLTGEAGEINNEGFSIRYDNSVGDTYFENKFAGTYAYHFLTPTVEAFTIRTDGKVGVGTTSPGYIFDVKGEANVSSALLVNDMNVKPTIQAAFLRANTSNITADRAWNHANAAYSFANSIAITANSALPNTSGVSFNGDLSFPSGSINLGNASGTARLTVNATTSSAVVARLAGATTGNNSQLRFWGRGANRDLFAIGTDIANGDGSAAFDVFDLTSNLNRLRVDPTGNVLIGRTNSTIGQNVKLDINGAVNAAALLVTGNVNFDAMSATKIVEPAANTLTFHTAQAERVRIDSSGRVGIGATSLDESLIVAGAVVTSSATLANKTSAASFDYASGFTSARILAWGPAGGTANISFWSGSGGGGATERMRIDASGNVGIGISSPSYKLHVNGSFAATTKSFVIDHPTKPDMKLRYGSLEGPENGVYVRGRLDGQSVIELPDYWWNLVDERSITVNITPIGKSQDIWVQSTSARFVHLNQPADCFFTVFAERKDVEKLVVEF